MNHDELDQLIHRYLDGLATDDNCVRFDKVMRNQPEARQAFWKLAEVHALAGDAFLISENDVSKDVDKNTSIQVLARETGKPLLCESKFASGESNSGLIGTWASIAAVSCAILIGFFAWR